MREQIAALGRVRQGRFSFRFLAGRPGSSPPVTSIVILKATMISPTKEDHDKFYSGKADDRIQFVINDGVRIIRGPNAGKVGAVISLQAVNPETTYLVELGDGSGDIDVPQSNLELIAPPE
ncbi:hypothetical protein [Syntrophotalea carbinolica]|nr:hypothetical protein [Syntrophotalea carbinolica]